MIFAVGDIVRPKPLHAGEGLPSGEVRSVADYPPSGQNVRVGNDSRWLHSGYFERVTEEKA